MELQFVFPTNFLRLMYRGYKMFKVYCLFFIPFPTVEYFKSTNKIMTLKALMRLFILFQFTLIANCVESGDIVVEALKALFKDINKPLQPIAVICWSVG